MTDVRMRLLTRDDVFLFYGARMPQVPIVGISLVDSDNKLLAIAGVSEFIVPFAFSILTDEGRQYRKSIALMGKRFRTVLELYDRPIYASADPDEPTAHRFLKYVGFKQIGKDVHVWEN